MPSFPATLDPTSGVKADGPAGAFAVLEYTGPDRQTIAHNLLEDSVVIGSDPHCDLRLPETSVAPVHAIVLCEGWTLSLRDLGTPSGTRVNGNAILTCDLQDGDLIEFGHQAARVRTNLACRPFRGFFLQRYRVLELLGSGGMSWIFGAIDLLTRQRVALKVLPSVHSGRMLAQFGIEARVGLQLEHPNIAQIRELCSDRATPFLVMEYLPGITTQELVEQQGPLPWRQACDVIRQAALGLSHLHQLGVIHRDIKPANLLVMPSGAVKIIDLGLALDPQDPAQLELQARFEKHVIGTADYISPEQSRRSHLIDARADLYSLGCVLYFLLVGKTLFQGNGVKEKLAAHRAQIGPDLRSLLPNLPSGLHELLNRLLAKSPEERPATAQTLADELLPWSLQQELSFEWIALKAQRAKVAELRLRKLLDRQQGSETPEKITLPIEYDWFRLLGLHEAAAESGRQTLGEVLMMWPLLSASQQSAIVHSLRKQADIVES